MKKLLVTLLILGIAAGAFAQVKTTITADFNPELMRVTSPSGELAKEEYQRSAGTFDALSSTSNGSIGQEDQLRIRFDWSGEGFSARINFNADRIVRWYGTGAGAAGMVNGNGKAMTAQNLLDSAIEEWYLRGSTGPLSGFVGTSGDRGKTDRFAGGFDDYTKGKIDNYGLITPSNPGTAAGDILSITRPGTLANITPILADGYKTTNGQIPGFGLHDVDNNNFGRAFNTGRNTTYGRADMAYWSATLDFGQLAGVPLFLAVKGDIGANSGFANLWPPDRTRTDNTGLDYSKLNGGVRVSGVKLGTIITFDAIYQFRGGDADTWENDTTGGGNIQPDGVGVTAHTFGLYANLFVVNNLGIGIGYSGLFKTYEDLKTSPTSVTQTSTGPFFHGVDLRFQFTGVPNLTITLNNAFTLAFVDATSEPLTSKRVVGLSGYDLVNGSKEEEAWYALYNGLAINYKLSPALTANFGVSNKMGLFYYDDARPETNNLSVKFMTNQLGATVNAKYQFNSAVMMQGGLQFFYDYASIDVKTTSVAKNFDSGMMYFAIPLRLQVVY
jgi:hypothetical protein